MKDNLRKFTFHYIIPAILGIVAFLIIYGFTPLDVTNDAWIMAGYDENDIIQHYAGWVMFRASDWSFPLGMIEKMAEGTGTILTYTDSIPLVAILFKAIDFLLPETFQYFGWYILVCFILQSIAAYKIIERKTDNLLFCYAGSVFFICAPIFLERSFRHTALGSQWIVLFAILTYLKNRGARRDGRRLFPKSYIILNVLAIMIHPYLLPMVMIFTLLTAWENALCFKMYLKYAGYFIFNIVITACTGWLIGAIGWVEGFIRGDYGWYSMNVNALINPTSAGNYTWSRILPVLPQIYGNYDGFNYLGGGILLLGLVAMMCGLKKWISCTDKNVWIKQNIWLISVLLFLTFFSITNIVTLNDMVALRIPIPGWFLSLCSIFRASARMFYPVYYVIFIYIIYQLAEVKSEKLGLLILAMGLAVQIFDLSGVIGEKHQRMQANSTSESILAQEEFIEMIQGHEKMSFVETWDSLEMYSIAVLAGKNGISTSYSVAGGGNYADADKLCKQEVRALGQGEMNEKIIYVTQDIEIFGLWVNEFDEDSIYKYYYNGFYYLIPKL